MKKSASFITSYILYEKFRKAIDSEKIGGVLDRVLRDYLAQVKSKKVLPGRYLIADRDRKSLSVKIDPELDYQIKHQALLLNIKKQDIINNAISEFVKSRKK